MRQYVHDAAYALVARTNRHVAQAECFTNATIFVKPTKAWVLLAICKSLPKQFYDVGAN